MKAHKTLPKTLFGTGKAEVFLVDILNQLAKPNATAKCMAMISTARAWRAKFDSLITSHALPLRDVSNLVRLHKTECAQRFSAMNKELDQSLKDWAPELTNEAFYAKELEVKALKLAMNIATGALKQVGVRATRLRVDQIKRDRRLQDARRSVRELPADRLAALKLTGDQELEVLKLVRAALRTPT